MGKKIYDITKELFSSEVYFGDPSPSLTKIQEIKNGDECNLSMLTMCLHNGTHIDAPCHFLDGEKDITTLDLESVIGDCIVVEWSGLLDENNAKTVMDRLFKRYGIIKRLLLKGRDVVLNLGGATVLTNYDLCLIGVEKSTVGNEREQEDVEQVHRHLLKNEIVILESLDLSQVKEGAYMLLAQPLKIQGADGAPCRAILLES